MQVPRRWRVVSVQRPQGLAGTGRRGEQARTRRHAAAQRARHAVRAPGHRGRVHGAARRAAHHQRPVARREYSLPIPRARARLTWSRRRNSPRCTLGFSSFLLLYQMLFYT